MGLEPAIVHPPADSPTPCEPPPLFPNEKPTPPLLLACVNPVPPDPESDPPLLLVMTLGMIDPDELEKLDPDDLLPLPLLEPLDDDDEIESWVLLADGLADMVGSVSLCVHTPSARYVLVPGTQIATVRTRPSMCLRSIVVRFGHREAGGTKLRRRGP